jgi:hypothetical protein
MILEEKLAITTQKLQTCLLMSVGFCGYADGLEITICDWPLNRRFLILSLSTISAQN